MTVPRSLCAHSTTRVHGMQQLSRFFHLVPPYLAPDAPRGRRIVDAPNDVPAVLVPPELPHVRHESGRVLCPTPPRQLEPRVPSPIRQDAADAFASRHNFASILCSHFTICPCTAFVPASTLALPHMRQTPGDDLAGTEVHPQSRQCTVCQVRDRAHFLLAHNVY